LRLFLWVRVEEDYGAALGELGFRCEGHCSRDRVWLLRLESILVML
jgi:hypothetical protein